jgi:hypothetical protein
LKTFQIDIAAADLAAMSAEFLYAGKLSVSAFAGYQPREYPIVFHYQGETVTHAFIRLKGQSSWQQAVQLDGPNGKMQFVLVFDHDVSTANFHGLGKITLDMPRGDLTFLHDRLANSWMRSVGVPALCATSARLEINGAYYGLYVAEQHIGKAFLRDFFPGDAGGDLFKGASIPETNASSYNRSRLAAFWAVTDPASLAAIVDIPGSLAEWAGEVLLNDGDGYWGGGHNYYIYDQGAKGYVWLPDDLDSTFDWLGSFTGDPITWWSTRHDLIGPEPHFMIVMNDPTLRGQYLDALDMRLGQWNVTEIQSWIDDWSSQIRDAVATDPHKPSSTTLKSFDAAVALARRGVKDRADFVKSWLDCRRSGSGPDKDKDGYIWCMDCRDDNAAIHPGAREICRNGVDDNCDGLFDNQEMCF